MDDKITQEPIEGQAVLPGFEVASQVEEEHHAQDVVKDDALEQLAAEAEKSTRRQIYNPVKKHYTPEQLDRLAALDQEEAAVIEEIHKYTEAMQEAQRTGNNQLINELMGKTTEIMAKKYDPITTAQNEIHRAAEQVYIDSFEDCEDITAAIMADAMEILGSITKQHYLVYQMKLSESLGQALREPDKMSIEDAAAFRTLSEMAAVSIRNCEYYLYQNLRVQHNAFSYYGLNDDPLTEAMAMTAAGFFQDNLMEEKLEDLPQDIKPKSYIMLNSYLANKLAHTKGYINDPEGFNAKLFDSKKPGEEPVVVFIAMENQQIKGEDGKPIATHFTREERDFENATYSLIEQQVKSGRKVIIVTPERIARALPGSSDKPSKATVDSIRAWVQKCENTDTQIDATDEFRARKVIGSKESWTIKEKYFYVREHTYTKRGKNRQTIQGWEFVALPIMYRYSKMNGGLLTEPAKYLEITKTEKIVDATGKEQVILKPQALSMNDDRRAMTLYMFKRISLMKRDLKDAKERLRKYNKYTTNKDGTKRPKKSVDDYREMKDTILFDTLFKETETITEDREIARRDRDFCLSVMDFWKASGYIFDYSVIKKGRSTTGISILLEPPIPLLKSQEKS